MEYKIIDSHCHPQFPQYDPDRRQVIESSLEAGVGMVCVGTDLETSIQAIALAKEYEGLWAAVGQHPNEPNLDIAEFEKLVRKEKERIVAIGEIGLDYFRSTDHEEQKARFMAQLQLALDMDKPVIIHCRDAHDDMLAMLPVGRGVIHSFNGSIEQANAYIKKGFCIGLNAIVTFSPVYAGMVKALPLESILLETDAPYLAPGSHRGQRNEPVYILETAKLIADIRGGLEDISAAALTNARRLFNM